MFSTTQGSPNSNYNDASLGGDGQSSHLGAGGLLDPRPAQPEVANQRRRFGEPLKFLPIVFVACTIFGLYLIYVFCHCVPLLQLHVAQEHIDHKALQRGRIEIVVFHIITALLLVCYVRSILVHPGSIPDNDMQWEYLAQDCTRELAPMNLQETKKTGDRRHCKWCGKYKPDRCHHCRVCKTCILKMDHHCPWIYNCVGFANYKCFFLLLLYCVLDCHLIVWTMLESVKGVIEREDTTFSHMFLILFGETLAFFLGVLTTLFFGFHIWLMFKAMTTIEFCEKSLPKKDKPHQEGADKMSYDSSVYDLGFAGNVRAVLGDRPSLWLLPWSRPPGDGLNFMSDETRLTTDMEAGRGMRRKTHQKTQRAQRRMQGSSLRNGGGYGDALGGSGYGPGYYEVGGSAY